MTTSYESATGRVLSVASTAAAGNVTLSFGYAGPLLTKSTMTLQPGTPEVQWQYDHWLRVSERRVKAGATTYPVTYGFDADGLLTSTALKNASASVLSTQTITRDTLGVGLPLSAANSTAAGGAQSVVTEAFVYSGFGELKRYEATTGATTWLRIAKPTDPNQGITRDALGRIVSRKDTVATLGALPATVQWDYTYDARGRLATAMKDGVTTTTYTYDENGNRTLVSGGASSTATYDLQDRMTVRDGVAYVYRNNGSLWKRGTDTFDYDLRGNLRQYTSGATTVDYLIDGQNRRVGKKVGGTLTTMWAYDDQLRIAAQLDGAGAIQQVYAYGVKGYAPELMYQPAGGKVYRVVSDMNGSVRLVIDVTTATPTLCHRIDYDPWGVRTEATNAACSTYQAIALGYAGGLTDSHTGFVRFGARDYDPASGRWTTKDPIRFDGGVNLYVYSSNEPVSRVDPAGTLDHQTCSALYLAVLDQCKSLTGMYNFSTCMDIARYAYQVCRDIPPDDRPKTCPPGPPGAN